jgi:hypothetical protein
MGSPWQWKAIGSSATQFQAVLTIDKKIKNEQNLNTLPIDVVVIMARTNRLQDIEPFVPAVEEALKSLQPGTLVEVFIPSR